MQAETHIWVQKNAPIVAGQEPYLHARGSDKSNNTAASVDQ